jgi:diphthamide biosynthesis protein 3
MVWWGRFFLLDVAIIFRLVIEPCIFWFCEYILPNLPKMSDDEELSVYDEIEIEDMTFDGDLQLYHYPCPCGDRFQITLDDLRDNADIAVCPSCSLMIRVIFDLVSQETGVVPIERVIQMAASVGDVMLTTLLPQDDLPKKEEPKKDETPAQVPIAA